MNRKTLIILTSIFFVTLLLGGWFVFRDKKVSQETQKPPVVRENTTQKPKMVWYKIPELKVELQVEENVADNIGYRDWYVENDKVGYELYAKNTPEIRGGFKNDSFAKITGYFDYKTDPHIMGWAIACAGNSCCFSNPSTQKLLIKTDTAIICYSDDSFSKELNQQNGVVDEYDPITKKLFDGYLKNVLVREIQ